MKYFMANFESGVIGGVVHIHLDMEPGDLEALISNPTAFIQAHDPNNVVPMLPAGVPVTYEIFTWSKEDDVEDPNVCEGGGMPNSTTSCLCTPAALIATDAHFRIYVNRA